MFQSEDTVQAKDDHTAVGFASRFMGCGHVRIQKACRNRFFRSYVPRLDEHGMPGTEGKKGEPRHPSTQTISVAMFDGVI